MKKLDVPQSGKRGLTVNYDGRYGLVSRALAIPAQPNTTAQLKSKSALQQVAALWRSLTQAQMKAWDAQAALARTNPVLGLSGKLTGFLLFCSINITCLDLNLPLYLDPPPIPTFPPYPSPTLSLTAASGVVTMRLLTTGDWLAPVMMKACSPESAGKSKPGRYKVLGILPTAGTGICDFTALYTSVIKTFPVKDKLFCTIEHVINGYHDIPLAFVGVPVET
jgi:hypothetical protein